MKHIVYLDTKAGELQKILSGKKKMIIRGAAGRKMPYGRVNAGDVLLFINNNGEGKIRAKAVVKNVFNSEKLSLEESKALLRKNQDKLDLTASQFDRWGGKRYIILIEISDTEEISSFEFDKSRYQNMDDWIILESEEIYKV
jgi:hypothetical protein